MTEHKGVEEYFAGVLQGREKEVFQHHLETCVVCQQHLKELRELDAELRRKLPRSVRGKEPPSDWVKSLVAKVMEHKRES